MINIYTDNDYANKNPSWHEEDAPWKASQITRILMKNKIKFNSICDIGCGTGDIIINLSNIFNFSSGEGFEISPHAYAIAIKKQTDRIKFHNSSFPRKSDRKFDVCLAIDVMEHVDDYLGFATSMRSLSTYKLFHIPLDLSVQSILRAWPILNLRKDVGHLHYFFKETALATLESCGYEIVDYSYTASRLELPNQALSSKLVSWPRRAFFSLNPDLTVRVLGGYSLLVLAK